MPWQALAPYGPAVLAAGLGLAVTALAALGVGEWRSRQARTWATQAPALEAPRSSGGRRWLLPLALAGLALALRLWGLGEKSISHPEVYVPGIPLPAGISEPPPRIGLAETLSWHFHDEPHPQGYYLAMWAWTRLAGTGLVALRLPSAFLGALAVLLFWRLGELAYGRRVGLLAASLLALNGFHFYWSQAARMYALGAFLSVAATLLLARMAVTGRPRLARDGLYVAVTTAGLYTQLFFWPLLAVHGLWAWTRRRAPRAWRRRTLALQAVCVMLGTPLWTHAMYRLRRPPVPPPSAGFLRDYLTGGFLARPDTFSEPERALPAALSWLLCVAAVALIATGARALARAGTWRPAAPPPPPGRLVGIAAGMGVVAIGLALIAHAHQGPMAWTALLPVLALGIVAVPARLLPAETPAASRSGAAEAPASRDLVSLFALLALLPVAAIYALSFWRSLLADRAFLVFTPYLLLLIAAGLGRLGRRRRRAGLVAVAVLATHFWSLQHFRVMPMSRRDYQGLASALEASSGPEDLLFVPARSWRVTPLFYYLRPPCHRLVAGGYAAALAAHPRARVWVIGFPPQGATRAMRRALTAYAPVLTLSARRAQAVLYRRRDSPAV